MPSRPLVHKPHGWCKPPPKKVDPFYVSPEWRACRKEVLEACGHRCQWPECGERATHVDHKVPIKEGGSRLDKANQWGLCGFHHRSKTARHDQLRSVLGQFKRRVVA